MFGYIEKLKEELTYQDEKYQEWAVKHVNPRKPEKYQQGSSMTSLLEHNDAQPTVFIFFN